MVLLLMTSGSGGGSRMRSYKVTSCTWTSRDGNIRTSPPANVADNNFVCMDKSEDLELDSASQPVRKSQARAASTFSSSSIGSVLDAQFLILNKRE